MSLSHILLYIGEDKFRLYGIVRVKRRPVKKPFQNLLAHET